MFLGFSTDSNNSDKVHENTVYKLIITKKIIIFKEKLLII